MNKNFDRIEEHLRVLFEEKLPKILTGQQAQRTLVDVLIQAMENNIQLDHEGQLNAPDLFILSVPPEDLIEWQVHQDTLDDIAATLHQIGTQEKFLFQKPTIIELKPDIELKKGRVDISAHFSPKEPGLRDTAVMVQEEQAEREPVIPDYAMLIISGKTIFPLENLVVNIGRHSSNDLVLNDPHISRHHAQLRVIKDHYVIFDVGSTAGLFLNGKRISQATLHPGDVIRIGLINLIYNQEPTNTFPTSVLQINKDTDFPGDYAQ
jgi:hypothetical protein